MNKKSLTGIVLVILLHFNSTSQTNCIWASTAGDSAYMSNSKSITKDNFGNIYVTGSFNTSTITFGTTVLDNINTGLSDIFVVKYDSSGNVIWAKSGNGIDNDESTSIDTDEDGNVYVTGTFRSGGILFDSALLVKKSTYVNIGFGAPSDLFVVKYDSDGKVIWSKNEGINGYFNTPIFVSSSKAGSVFIAGSFYGDSITFSTTTLYGNISMGNVFLARYDVNGNVIWAKSASSNLPFEAYAYGFATDSSGNAFITGKAGGNIIHFDTTTLTTGLFFVVKYNSSGSALWAKQPTQFDSYGVGVSVTTDKNGNVFVVGTGISDSTTFDSQTVHDSHYLLKIEAAGNVVWVKSFRGDQITTDDGGNIYTCAAFNSDSVVIGSTTLFNKSLAGGTADIFVGKYDLNGTPVWAESAGGIQNDFSNAITVDEQNNVYITGNIADSATFGNHKITGNMFVAKYAIQTVGIDELPSKMNFIIFPNPATTKLFIETNGTDIEQINIYNTTGSLVSQTKLPQSKSIDVNGFAPGVYVAEIKTKEVCVKRKWVKM